MTSKDISSQKFEMTLKGYRTDDVDDFLFKVQEAFAKLEKDRIVLEDNLKVLWAKVDKYREDESALAAATINAQKSKIVLEKEGQLFADKIKKEAETFYAEKTTAAEKILADAKVEAERISSSADEKAKKLLAAAQNEAVSAATKCERDIALQRDILAKMKSEATAYRRRIVGTLNEFSENITLSVQGYAKRIEEFPEKCENDYIKKEMATQEQDKQHRTQIDDESELRRRHDEEVRQTLAARPKVVARADDFVAASHSAGGDVSETSAGVAGVAAAVGTYEVDDVFETGTAAAGNGDTSEIVSKQTEPSAFSADNRKKGKNSQYGKGTQGGRDFVSEVLGTASAVNAAEKTAVALNVFDSDDATTEFRPVTRSSSAKNSDKTQTIESKSFEIDVDKDGYSFDLEMTTDDIPDLK